MWESDDGSNEGFLKGVEVYIDEPKYAEILGADESFSKTVDTGFSYVSKFYKVGEGWVSCKSNCTSADQRFIKWYEPFKDLKVKWTNMENRCKNLASSRDLNSPYLSEMRDLCWSKSATSSS